MPKVIWHFGWLMMIVGVFGAPYRKYELDNDSSYNFGQFDTVYDQRQNGTENYKLSIDGLSLVWSPNSLIAAAALLEPALYGEYPDTNLDILLGPDGSKPETKPENKPDTKPTLEINNSEKPVKNPSEKPLENTQPEKPSSPTVLILDENKISGQNNKNDKRKIRLPGIMRPFLKRRTASLPLLVDKLKE